MEFNQQYFQEKYRISEKMLNEVSLTIEGLKAIFDDFVKRMDEYEDAIKPLTPILQRIDCVHSVRTRVKDPYHLLEKIYRKTKNKGDNTDITVETYRQKITDLVGLRALHLYKFDCVAIHNAILKNFSIVDKHPPTINYRDGDNTKFYDTYLPDVQRNKHSSAYRSIHYIVSTTPLKDTIYVEIQVRTLFEESWSEVDHLVRYPNNMDNPHLNELLLIFNRIAGMGDELAGYIKSLFQVMEKYETAIKTHKEEYERKLSEKISEVELLQQRVSQILSENNEKQEQEKIQKETIGYLESEVSRLRAEKIANSFDPTQRFAFQEVLPSSTFSPSRINLAELAQDIDSPFSGIPNLSALMSTSVDIKIKCSNLACQNEFPINRFDFSPKCPKCNMMNFRSVPPLNPPTK